MRWDPRRTPFTVVAAGGLLLGALLAATGDPVWTAMGNRLPYAAAAAAAVRAAVRATGPSRRGWQLVAAGLVAHLVGRLWLDTVPDPRGSPPPLAGLLWFYLCPLSAVGLVVLSRARRSRPSAVDLVDGLVVGLAVAGLGWAFVLDPAIPLPGPDGAGPPLTGLLPPVAGLALGAVVLARTAVLIPRIDRQWLTLVLGLGVVVVADAWYYHGTAIGTWSAGPADLLWPAGLVLVTLAAETAGPVRPDHSDLEAASPLRLVLPLALGLAGVGYLVHADVSVGPVGPTWLCAACIAVASVRSVLGYRALHQLAAARLEAGTDDLTGLANRRGFLAALRIAVEGATTARPLALLVLDLDRFKAVNDERGHAAGDELLIEIARRLRRCACRPGDVACRLGGDEFAIVLPATDRAEAMRTAEAVVLALAEPVLLGGVSVRVGASVGCAVAPADARDVDALLAAADAAMYRVKRGPSRRMHRCSDGPREPDISVDRVAETSDLPRSPA